MRIGLVTDTYAPQVNGVSTIVHPRDHDDPHPLNDSIPLVLAGPGVTRRHQLTRAISLLDLPATILWWFGVDVPLCYEGRPIAEAFQRSVAVAI